MLKSKYWSISGISLVIFAAILYAMSLIFSVELLRNLSVIFGFVAGFSGVFWGFSKASEV